MPKFRFTVELRWPAHSIFDAVADALYEVGCDDGLFSTVDNIPSVAFTREAKSLGDAIGSAVRDVMKIPILDVVSIHVDPPEGTD